jgi:hypothetical protein
MGYRHRRLFQTQSLHQLTGLTEVIASTSICIPGCHRRIVCNLEVWSISKCSYSSLGFCKCPKRWKRDRQGIHKRNRRGLSQNAQRTLESWNVQLFYSVDHSITHIGWMDGWMISFTPTLRKAICRLQQLYISVYVYVWCSTS